MSTRCEPWFWNGDGEKGGRGGMLVRYSARDDVMTMNDGYPDDDAGRIVWNLNLLFLPVLHFRFDAQTHSGRSPPCIYLHLHLHLGIMMVELCPGAPRPRCRICTVLTA
jgi:hypothetical protein